MTRSFGCLALLFGSGVDGGLNVNLQVKDNCPFMSVLLPLPVVWELGGGGVEKEGRMREGKACGAEG